MPIAIVGTGRSGTSMVARVLNLCGLYLGEQSELARSGTLAPEMNPSGYWEHPGVRDLMDRLFCTLGGTWENPPILADGWESDAAILPFQAEARELIARTFEGHGEWGWKLPKATITLAFWKRVAPELRFVICVRNPLDFASSLGQYTSISPHHLYAMWDYYNYLVLCNTRPDERFITHYERYFPNCDGELDQLIRFCGLSLPPEGSQARSEIARFMNADLKHFGSDFEDVLMTSTISYVTKELYTQMLSSREPGGHDIDLPNYRSALLPLLERAVLAEGLRDSSHAVSREEYEVVKLKLENYRAKYDIVRRVSRKVRAVTSRFVR